MVDSIEYFMQAALDTARAGLEKGELPIGAVVVVNDQIIAAAHTQEKSQGRFLVHADLLALEAADRLHPFPGKRRDAKLFVTGEPCLMCIGAAMSFFLGEIYYGHESPSDGAVALVQQWRRKEEDFPSYRVPKIVGGDFASRSHRLISGVCSALSVEYNLGMGENDSRARHFARRFGCARRATVLWLI